MGHRNVAHVRKFLRDGNIDFVDEAFACEVRVYGKHHCGEFTHTDVCGPKQTKDDFLHYRFVYFLKQKSEPSKLSVGQSDRICQQ